MAKMPKRGMRNLTLGEVFQNYLNEPRVTEAISKGRPFLLAVMDAYLADLAANHPGDPEVAAEIATMRETWGSEDALALGGLLQQLSNETTLVPVAVWHRKTLRRRQDDQKTDRGSGWYYDLNTTEDGVPYPGVIFPRGPYPTKRQAEDHAKNEWGDDIDFVSGEPALYAVARQYLADYQPYLIFRNPMGMPTVLSGRFGTTWTKPPNTAARGFMVSYEPFRHTMHASPQLFAWIMGIPSDDSPVH